MNYPYQQMSLFPQQTYQQPQMQPTQTTVIWAASEEFARQYPVAPGGTVYFMNESEPYFYAKSADIMGKPTFRKSRLLDETEPNDKTTDLTNYVKREEIENIITDAVQKEVEKRISEISFKPTRKPKVVDVMEE